MVTTVRELLPHVLVSALWVLWLIWIGRLVRLAFGSFRRSGTQDRRDHVLTRSDLQLLRSLNIRP